MGFDQINPSITKSLPVPRPAFDSLAFGTYATNDWINLPNATSIVLKGASAETSRIASAVAAGGDVLPIVPPASNTSWQVIFEAPRLRCSDMDPNLRTVVRDNILEALRESTANTTLYPAYDGSIGPVLSQYMPAYLSWANASQHGTEAPFVKYGDKWELVAQRYLYDAELSTNLYFGIFPRALNSSSLGSEFMNYYAWNTTQKAADAASRLLNHYFEDATLIRCNLGAANYSLQFSYVNSEQTIEALSTTDIPLDKTRLSEIRLGTSSNGRLDIETYRGTSDEPHDFGNPIQAQVISSFVASNSIQLFGCQRR